MKKKFLFLAAAVTFLAACTTEEVLNGYDPTSKKESGAINFGFDLKNATRADHVGADAAALLGNRFVVYGAKNTAVTTAGNFADTKVFDHYNVAWTENTAGKTESNTSDWEYVGQAKHPNADAGAADLQTIKYWDYATAQYDFIAYSTGTKTEITGDEVLGDGKLKVSAIAPGNATTAAYTVEGQRPEDFAGFYLADMVTVAKANYGQEVQLKFRNLATKVRLAMYEVIPGYSVKDVHFYTGAGASAVDGTGAAHLFGTTADVFKEKGTYTVMYPTIGGIADGGNSDWHKAHVGFAPAAGAASTSAVKNFSVLSNFAEPEFKEAAGDYLGRTAPTASYTYKAAVNDKGYLTVLPNETGDILNLKCDYTLVSTDGSGEEIHVTGATAQVPTIYSTWHSGYAYTYIFKISDNTNGNTGTVGEDPVGLYPITFDAIVVDDEQDGTQVTITTVATPSITTYQKGHVVTNDEYDNSDDIYVMVQDGATRKGDLNTKGKVYTVTGSTPISEATVADALTVGTKEDPEGTFTGRNGLTLVDAASTASVSSTITAIPGEDGNDITVASGEATKFTPAASTTYAYVYDYGWKSRKQVHVNVGDEITADTYYTDDECTSAVAAEASASSAGDYYVKNGWIGTAKEVTKGTAATDYYADPECTIAAANALPAADAGVYYQKVPENVAAGTSPTGYFTDAACTVAAPANGLKAGDYWSKDKVNVSAGTDPANYYTDAACTAAAAANGLAANADVYMIEPVTLNAEPFDWNATTNVYFDNPSCAVGSRADRAYADGIYYRKIRVGAVAETLSSEPTGWPTGYYTDAICTAAAPSTYVDGTYYHYTASGIAAGTDPAGYFSENTCTTPATPSVLKAGYYYAKVAHAGVTAGTDPTGYYTAATCDAAEIVLDGGTNQSTYVTTLQAGKYYKKQSAAVAVGTPAAGWFNVSDDAAATPTTLTAGTYYQKVPVSYAVYGVKVIKVQ